MTKVTIAQAKRRLGKLIAAAFRGERVVIMRGSKPAAAIVPVDEVGMPDLRVSDAAAGLLFHEARLELETGVARVCESAAVRARIHKLRKEAKSVKVRVRGQLDEVYATEPSRLNRSIARAQATAIARQNR